jgi:hypothetical protein
MERVVASIYTVITPERATQVRSCTTLNNDSVI